MLDTTKVRFINKKKSVITLEISSIGFLLVELCFFLDKFWRTDLKYCNNSTWLQITGTALTIFEIEAEETGREKKGLKCCDTPPLSVSNTAALEVWNWKKNNAKSF